MCWWCWIKGEFTIAKIVKWVKECCWEETELGAVLEKRKWLKEKKREKWFFSLYYDLSTIIFVIGYRLCLISFSRNSKTALSCIQVYEFPLSKLIRNMNHWNYLPISLGFTHNSGGFWFYYSTLVNMCYFFRF